MSFRVNAKNIFLTYPRFTLPHLELHTFLATLCDNVYSALEHHEDGTPHIHAIVSYFKKKDVRNQSFYDYEGFHCNIQACRSLESSITYIEKDGDTLGESPRDFNPTRQSRLTSLLNESSTPEDFTAGFASIDAHSYIIHNQRIIEFANNYYTTNTPITARPRSSFTEPSELTQWVASNLFPAPERPKCLILVGNTRLGKTEWARSLGEHSYWNNYVTTDRNRNARYAIIDDMERFDNFNGKKPIFGCQKVIGFNPKYSRLQQWDWGIPTIWLFNSDTLPPILLDTTSYYRQNAIFIEIYRPLF